MRIKLFEDFENEIQRECSRKLQKSIKRIDELCYLLTDEGLDYFIIGKDDPYSFQKIIVISCRKELFNFDGPDYLKTTREYDSWLLQQDFYQEFILRIQEICKEESVSMNNNNVGTPDRIIIYT